MQVIYNLIGMENKGESLPSPLTSATTGKKSGRKEEQYRLMFQVGVLASHWSHRCCNTGLSLVPQLLQY